MAQWQTKFVQWLVLIYTLPPEPTRKRAFVWRELKKIGAVYLRDGVCLLPEFRLPLCHTQNDDS